MIQYIVMGFIAFLIILISIAMVEWVIAEVFEIEIGITKMIAYEIASLFRTIIDAIAAPFYALSRGIMMAEWGYAGTIIMVLFMLAILGGVAYLVLKKK